MAKECLLKINVLTDNILILPDEGKIFKGGYIAIVKEYFFLNAWNDKEKITRFRKESTLLTFLATLTRGEVRRRKPSRPN